jgi:hypothetical protein
MTRAAQARYIDQREESGAVAFDAALEAYLEGAHPGEPIEIEAYADAGLAIRRWFATMREPGRGIELQCAGATAADRPCIGTQSL